jgi:hypothetical protein
MAAAVKRIKIWLGLSPPAFAEEESNFLFFYALLLYAAHHSVAAAQISKDDAFRCLAIFNPYGSNKQNKNRGEIQ